MAFFQLLISGVFYSWITKKISHDEAMDKLEQLSYLLRPIALEQLQHVGEAQKADLFNRDANIRITLIRNDGSVIFDSTADKDNLENHYTMERTEVQEALTGRNGKSTRVSDSTHIEYLYLAIPVLKDDTLLGVLRLATPIRKLDGRWKEFLVLGLPWALLLMTFVTLISMIMAKRFVRPIEELQAVSEKLSNGEWDYQFPEGADYSYELANLRNSLDKMRTYIQGRLKKILKQKHELKSILSSVDEGLLTLNLKLEVFHYNAAFIKLFALPEKFVTKGEALEKLLLPIEIGVASKQILAGEPSIEIDLSPDKKTFINVRLKPLMDGQNSLMGVLLVFSDRTKLVKLENMRKEFVSNVGHELKTPITAIQGYLETLLDGKVDDPELQKKFLRTTHEQTIRLNNLITDILKLSTIERENESLEVRLVPVDLSSCVQKSIEICSKKALDHNVKFQNLLPQHQLVLGDERLLEQVVINLLDNAIKYSHRGGLVEIGGESRTDGKYRFYVKDHGVGIPSDHHERIFERFYSVDKSRSRELGGTGLGLSIVKHILLTLKAQISLESEVNQGSTFIILINRPS